MKNRKDVFDFLRESQVKKLREEIEEVEGFANKDDQDYRTLQPGGGVPGPENDTEVPTDTPDPLDIPEEMPTDEDTQVTGEEVLREFDKIGTAFESLTSLGAIFSGVLSVLMGYRKGLVTNSTINNMDTLKLVIDITERMVYMNSAVLALEKELGEFYSQREDILKAFQIQPEEGAPEEQTNEEGEPNTNPEQMKPEGTAVEGEVRTESRDHSNSFLIESFAVVVPEQYYDVKVLIDNAEEAYEMYRQALVSFPRGSVESLRDHPVREGDQDRWALVIHKVKANSATEATEIVRQMFEEEQEYAANWDRMNKQNATQKARFGEKRDQKRLSDVEAEWEPEEGFFTKSATAIAQGLKAASKNKRQAVSRLNFYINRAGKNLSPKDQKRLELAKDKLQGLYESAEAPSLPEKYIAITYETITPAEVDGEEPAEESGWADDRGNKYPEFDESDVSDMTTDEIDEDEGTTSVDKAVGFLSGQGVTEASGSEFSPGVWYSVDEGQNPYDGSYTSYSYHLYGFSEEEQHQIFDRVMRRSRVSESFSDSVEGGADIVDQRGFQIGRVESVDEFRDFISQYADETRPEVGDLVFIDSDREDRPRMKMMWNGKIWVEPELTKERMFVPETPSYVKMIYNLGSDNEKEMNLVHQALKSVTSVQIKGSITNKNGKFTLPVEVHIQTGSEDPTREGYDIIRDAIKQAGNVRESRTEIRLAEEEKWDYHLELDLSKMVNDIENEAVEPAVSQIIEALRGFRKAYPEVPDTDSIISLFTDVMTSLKNEDLSSFDEDMEYALENLYDWADDHLIFVGA